MARIGDKKKIGGKIYTLKAVAQSKLNAERDARILKRHGYVSVVIRKQPKAGFRTLPKWLVYGKFK